MIPHGAHHVAFAARTLPGDNYCDAIEACYPDEVDVDGCKADFVDIFAAIAADDGCTAVADPLTALYDCDASLSCEAVIDDEDTTCAAQEAALPDETNGCAVGIGPAPTSWTCDPTYWGDSTCDCGCNVDDPACDGGTSVPGETDAACEYCFDASGAEIACTASTGEGEGDGEGEDVVGEGEGEDDTDTDTDTTASGGCAATDGSLSGLAVLGLVLRRRRR